MNDPSVAGSSEDTAQTRASPRRALLFTGFAWLSIAVVALRFTCAPVTTDVVAFLAAAAAGFLAHLVASRSEQGARAAATAGAAGPFQRLGNTNRTTGVGLGLAVSRGLIEAMRGTLRPAQTPGGGLTMTMSLPAASS
jgi:hypothetical protein